MNDLRQHTIETSKTEIEKVYDKIKDDPNPDIYDLWFLDEKHFKKWRKIHDFPKLLAHFDSTLLLFEEWKSDSKLSNELIINTGELTPFFEKKKLSGDTTLYLTEESYNNEISTFVSPKFLSGSDEEFEYRNILKFSSYLDWLADRQKSERILKISSRRAPKSDTEIVYIHNNGNQGFELLKMGGIEAPTLLRGKRLEFVNLCGLKLNDEINFIEAGSLSCSYSACDNIIADNINIGLLKFEHCSMKNITIKESIIRQWRFYDCNLTGTFSDSQFRIIRIWGGSFDPIMKGCNISNFHIERDNSIKDMNFPAYQLLKTTYAEQGDDENAIKYFIKEKEYLRDKLKGKDYWFKTLSYYYWGYGREPHRIIWFSLISIFAFAIFYFFNNELITINSGTENISTFWDTIYFSSTTFTTLGYGDYSPNGIARIGATIESIIGVLNVGFLVAGFTSNKY